MASDTEGLRGAGGAPVVGRHVVSSSLVPCRAALEQMKYCNMLYSTPCLEAEGDGTPCTRLGYTLCVAMLALDTGTVGNIPRYCLDVLRGRVDVLEATNDVGQHATR